MGAVSLRAGKLKLLMVALPLVGVLALASGGVLFMKSRAGHPAEKGGKEASAEEEEETTEEHGDKPAEESGDKPAKEGEEALPLEVVDLGEFLVNVKSGSGLRYLRTQVAVEVTPPAEEGEKKGGGHGGGHGAKKGFELPPGDQLRAKDAVVKVLTASDFASLQADPGREDLKKRLAATLGKALPKYKLGQILLVSFVMQ